MRTKLSAGLAALLALALSASASACTTFCLRDGGRIVFGKNYDWAIGDGLLVVNKRGVARKAHLEGNAEGHPKPASWTSRFGSVTFNQYGRDFPSGGINEKGLTIELMWLAGSRYPAADARPAVDVLQWIQYNLDNHATVAEVLKSDQSLRISGSAPLHYLVADRQGQVATVEFLDGRMVAHTGQKLPVAALANDPYADSLRSARSEDRSRFARAAQRVRGFEAKGTDAVGYAFETLDQVAQPGYTQWSIVYEVDRGRVHFRTRDRRKVRSLDLEDVDFSCSTPVLVLDLDANAADTEGDVARRLVPYTREINRELVTAAFRKTDFLAGTPAAEIEHVVRYPESASCRR
jgi:penicillin V acylase-like amidase (Ntn superfamily)